MIKLQVKESIIEVEPIKTNALLQLAFLLKLGEKKESYNIKRDVLKEAIDEFTFYYGLLEKAGIFPYEKSIIKEDQSVQ